MLRGRVPDRVPRTDRTRRGLAFRLKEWLQNEQRPLGEKLLDYLQHIGGTGTLSLYIYIVQCMYVCMYV